jgi:hypothetical protein
MIKYDIQGDPFRPLGSILPFLQGVRRASSQAWTGRRTGQKGSTFQELGKDSHRDANGVDTQRL